MLDILQLVSELLGDDRACGTKRKLWVISRRRRPRQEEKRADLFLLVALCSTQPIIQFGK